MERRDGDLAGVAALADPTRRLLYDHVVAARVPLTRDELAEATGINRQTVRFNLDRLVEEGLLATEFRRPEGRTGPGAGRTAKYYRRSDREFAVSVPARRYDLAAKILADAVGRAVRDGAPIMGLLREEALAAGAALGAEAGELRPALDSQGYDSRLADGVVTLGNCPFAGVLGEDTYIICTLSRDLIDGIVAGCGASGRTDWSTHDRAVDPSCCVQISLTAAGKKRRPTT